MTDYYTSSTCFDTIVLSSGSSQLVPCWVTLLCQCSRRYYNL